MKPLVELTPAQLKSIERTLSAGTWTITFGAVLFSVLTVTPLVQRVTSDAWDWTAPILPIVVDAAVVIVIRLDAAVSRLGEKGGRWPDALRWLTGAFTLALNTGDSALDGDKVGVAVHSVAPLLLIFTAEAALGYRRAITRALDCIARERAAEAERERRERDERERRERQEREDRERREREEREQEREARERSEREAREHQDRLAREQREEERERREFEAAQEAAREERQRRDQREREDREREDRERERKEQREREERERQEKRERDERERLDRLARDRVQAPVRERPAAPRREQSARPVNTPAPAAVNTSTGKPVNTPAPRPVNGSPARSVNTPAADTANTVNATDKMPEPEALNILRAEYKTTSVRKLAARTGWSTGWVSEHVQAIREEHEHQAAPAELAGTGVQ